MRTIGRLKTRASRWAIPALCLLAAFSCTRDYDSPYVPGSEFYAGPEWTEDGDGDGVADSVAKYAPECDMVPKECLEMAKVVKVFGRNYRLRAADMILWRGSPGAAPRLTWSPAQASALGVTLRSSDTSKVRIRDGLLEAVGTGNAQVTATVRSDSRAVAFIVKVVTEGKPVTGISAEDLAMRVGEEAPPVLSWLPVDAEYREYILSIDSPQVAKVSGGRIKALSPGVAKVLVEALDGGHRGAFTLTVKDIPLQVEAVSALVEDMYLLAGGPAESPIVHWTPSNVSRKAWLLAPVNPEVAEVSKEGDQVVPLKQGKTGMTFYSLDGSGLRATFTVHVTDDPVPVRGIAATDLKLTRGGDPTPPRLVWTPAEATDRRYALSTDNPLVADITGNLIVPLDTGTANLTVVTRDGSLSDTFRVEVAVPDSAIRVDSLRAMDMTLTVGSRRRPTLDWFPANAFNRKYTLTSSNPQVAAADSESVLAVAQGSADFTVVTSDGGHKATFRVGVGRILVQRVTAEDLSMLAGAEAEPSLTFVPADASDLAYTLRSLDTTIVTVTSDSTSLKAVQVGNAKVVARSKDGPMDTLVVTVLAQAIPVNRMEVTAITINVGDPVDRDVGPSITWEPTYATNKGFRLVSSSNASAVVIVDNRLRGLSAGESRVVIASLDQADIRDTFTVTARVPLKSIAVRDTAVWQGSDDFDPSRLIMWTPPNATNKGFTMRSLDSAVAKVLPDNLIRPGTSGSANVVVTSAENPARVDTFKVTVKIPVKTLTVLRDTTVWAGVTGMDIGPLLSWTPSNATEKWWWLEWVGTPDTSMLRIGDSWTIDAKGPGQARLAVIHTHDHNIRDTLTVTVKQAVQSISVPDYAIRVGDPDLTPEVSFTPANATDKGYTLSSSAPGIAAIANGKIHAAGPGVAEVTARSNEGGKTDSFTVTVIQPVASVNAAAITLRLGEGDKDAPVTIQPSNASNKSYVLAPASEIVTVVNNKLHPVSQGNTTVGVTTVDGGKTTSFVVTVVQPVTGIAAGNITVVKDTDGSPLLTWTPSDATDKSYSLVSLNLSVASINGGKVRGVGGGSSIITVITTDGGKVATFTATVTVPVASIIVANTEMRLGDPDLFPTIQWVPSDATNRNVTLASSDPAVATIVNGKIRAIGRGRCVITVTAVDGGKKTTFTLDVKSGALP